MKFTKPQILLSLLIPPTILRLNLYIYISSCMACFPQGFEQHWHNSRREAAPGLQLEERGQRSVQET